MTPLTLPTPARGEGISLFACCLLHFLNRESFSCVVFLPLPLRERTEVRGVVQLNRIYSSVFVQ